MQDGHKVRLPDFQKMKNIILLSIIFSSCSNDSSIDQPVGLANLELGIKNIIPNSLGKEYSNNFNRYTNIVTPNGGKIHIVAQSNLTDEQIVRARSTLEHFLENYPGSK